MTRPGSPVRTRLQRALAALLVAAALPATAMAQNACEAVSTWPLWQTFSQRFLQADGRVVDFSVPQQHTTSEGQSYGMFFALVANDPASFERMWRWSVANLANGDVASRLPAWQWGKSDSGTWGVLDPNAASDADLWFAYALLEGGRVWNRADYVKDAHALLARIALDEVADLPGLGKMLLPGPAGFALPDGVWRLNPSYLPLPLLRRLAAEDKNGPWQAIATNTAHMVMTTAAAHGLAPDWVAYRAEGAAFVVDPQKGDVGSYDAIRTYLWAGMTSTFDPLAGATLKALDGMTAATLASGLPPESVQAVTGTAKGTGPVGFSAALLPYFQTNGQTRLYNAQRDRVQAQLLAPAPSQQNQPPYYDQVLGLFGSGWAEQRYRFLSTGKVQLRWEKACPRAATR